MTSPIDHFVFTVSLFIFFIATASSLEYHHTFHVSEVAESVKASWTLDLFATAVRKGISGTTSFPWDIVQALFDPAKNGDPLSVLPEVITSQLGVLIPAGFGLLAGLLIIPVTCCFCCCRLCGNCGAKVQPQTEKKTVARNCNGVAIFVCIAILSAMMFTIPLSGERMLASPKLLKDSLTYSLADFPAFLSKFVNESVHAAEDVLNNVIQQANKTLNGFPALALDPLKTAVSKYMESIQAEGTVISDVVASLPDIEMQINASITGISKLSENLNSTLHQVQTSLTALQTKCNAEKQTFCQALDIGFKPDPVTVDLVLLKTLADDLAGLVKTTRGVDVNEYISLSSTAFSSVESTIGSTTKDAVNEVMEKLDDIPGTFLPMITHTLQAIDVSIINKTVGRSLEPVYTSVDTFYSAVGNNLYIGGAVLAVLIAVILIMTAVGCVIGCWMSTHQTYNVDPAAQRTSQRQQGNCSSNTLMCSVALSVLPVMVLLLVGSLLLLVGGLFTIICAPVQDLTILEKLIDSGALLGGRNIGALLLKRNDTSISLAGVVRVCRGGGTLLSGLGAGNFIDPSKLSGKSSMAVELPGDIYSKINDSLSDVSLYDSSKIESLSEQLKFPKFNIGDDLVTPMAETSNLKTFAEALERAAHVMSAEYASACSKISEDLRAADTDLKEPLYKEMADLSSNVKALSEKGRQVKVAVLVLNETLTDLQDFVVTRSSSVVTETVHEMVKNVTGLGGMFVHNLLMKYSTSVGKCKPIADMYDATTGSICHHFLNAFNVCWASMFVSGFIIMILMIVNCAMEKHFRIPIGEREIPVSRFDNISERNAVELRHVTVNADPNISNSALRRKSQYRSFWKTKLRQNSYSVWKRGKYSTSSDSPQLLRIQQLDSSLSQAIPSGVSESVKVNTDLLHSIDAVNEVRSCERKQDDKLETDTEIEMNNFAGEEEENMLNDTLEQQDLSEIISEDSTSLSQLDINGHGGKESVASTNNDQDTSPQKNMPNEGPENLCLGDDKSIALSNVFGNTSLPKMTYNLIGSKRNNKPSKSDVTNVHWTSSFSSKQLASTVNQNNVKKKFSFRKPNIDLHTKLMKKTIDQKLTTACPDTTITKGTVVEVVCDKLENLDMSPAEITGKAACKGPICSPNKDSSQEFIADQQCKFLNTPSCKIKCSLCKNGGLKSKLGFRYSSAIPVLKQSSSKSEDRKLISGNGDRQLDNKTMLPDDSLESTLNEFEVTYEKLSFDRNNTKWNEGDAKMCNKASPLESFDSGRSDKMKGNIFASGEMKSNFDDSLHDFESMYRKLAPSCGAYAKRRSLESSFRSKKIKLDNQISERRRKSLNVEVRPYKERESEPSPNMSVISSFSQSLNTPEISSPAHDQMLSACNFAHRFTLPRTCNASTQSHPTVSNHISDGKMISSNFSQGSTLPRTVSANSRSHPAGLYSKSNVEHGEQTELNNHADISAATQTSFDDIHKEKLQACEGQLVELLCDIEKCIDPDDDGPRRNPKPKPLSVLASKVLLEEATSKYMPQVVYGGASMEVRNNKVTYL